MKQALLLAAALGSAGASSGCAMVAVPATATAGVLLHQDRTPGQDLDDAAVSTKIKARLLAYDSAAFGHVGIEVALGEVLLSGTVPTDQARLDGARIAATVTGAEKIDNQIVVGRAESLAEGAHDEWISARVRAKLLADRDVKAINFNIETRRGVVYLMGLARSPEEARRAAQTAAYVGGVVKVISFVHVRQDFSNRDVASDSAPIEAQGGAGPVRAPSLSASMEASDRGPY